MTEIYFKYMHETVFHVLMNFTKKNFFYEKNISIHLIKMNFLINLRCVLHFNIFYCFSTQGQSFSIHSVMLPKKYSNIVSYTVLMSLSYIIFGNYPSICTHVCENCNTMKELCKFNQTYRK